MSRQHEASATCPKCNRLVSWTSYSSVNVTHDPSLREKVFNGELFTFSCPECGLRANLSESLLYHDMARTFMVQLVPESEPFDGEKIDAPQRALGTRIWETVRAITTRVVRSPNELIEKVLIFEADLDDRHVECLKLRLKLQQGESFPGEIFFDGRAADGDLTFAHLHEGAQQSFVIRAELWRQHVAVVDGIGPRNSERWPRVDQEYALRLYEGLAAREKA